MSRPERDKVLEAIRSSKAPGGMRTRVIAVDGPGGAGKSTLAEWLARQLSARIVHTDDFASWEKPIDWWPNLLETVLEPLAAGQTVRYKPNSWGGPDRDNVIVEPTDFLILEGVTASREAFRPYLAFSIWIDTPRELRLHRGLQRDGDDARARWDDWMAQEDAYIRRERPADHADLVLPGDEGICT